MYVRMQTEILFQLHAEEENKLYQLVSHLKIRTHSKYELQNYKGSVLELISNNDDSF